MISKFWLKSVLGTEHFRGTFNIADRALKVVATNGVDDIELCGSEIKKHRILGIYWLSEFGVLLNTLSKVEADIFNCFDKIYMEEYFAFDAPEVVYYNETTNTLTSTVDFILNFFKGKSNVYINEDEVIMYGMQWITHYKFGDYNKFIKLITKYNLQRNDNVLDF